MRRYYQTSKSARVSQMHREEREEHATRLIRIALSHTNSKDVTLPPCTFR